MNSPLVVHDNPLQTSWYRQDVADQRQYHWDTGSGNLETEIKQKIKIHMKVDSQDKVIEVCHFLPRWPYLLLYRIVSLFVLSGTNKQHNQGDGGMTLKGNNIKTVTGMVLFIKYSGNITSQK